MHQKADKTKDRKSQSVANNTTQKKRKSIAIGHTEENQFQVPTNSPTRGPQFEDNRPEALAQTKLIEAIHSSPRNQQAAQLHKKDTEQPVQKKPASKDGLPDQLRSGIESLSGYAKDDVKVHYNSDKPAQLNAHAYA